MSNLATLGIKIDSSQAGKAASDLDRLTVAGAKAEKSTDELTRSSVGLSRALGVVAASFGVSQIVKYADAYASVNARLQLVTNSQAQYARVQNDLVQLADQTRSSLTGTVDLYARIARSTKELNATDSERLTVTKAINQALIVSGASGASAEAALVQLGQGFASGVLRGEELNSVMEQTPRLARAIADGLGVTIGKLRELGAAGKLTSGAVFDALRSQAGSIEAEYAKIPTTISQALTVAENRLQQFIGTQADASGASKALVGTIDVLSKNIDVLTAAAAGFAATKLAEVLLSVAARAQASLSASAQYVVALQAQRAATLAAAQSEAQGAAAKVASAQAEVQGTVAKIAGLKATEAAIVASRADTVAKLQAAQAAATQAQVTIAAASAAGALSFALATQRQSTEALVAAQSRQVVLSTELAVLGTQQARVQASIAAATTAQTAASSGLIAATSAQTAAQAGLATAATRSSVAVAAASRVLGLLGGPIGLITTALGLGATAWVLWGNSAETAATKAETALKKARESLQEDLAAIQRLDGLMGKIQAGGGGDDSRNARLNNLRASAQARVEAARRAIENAAATKTFNESVERNSIARRVDPVAIQNRQQAALSVFLEENATKTEKFNRALAETKQKLGSLFTPEIEKRLREKFFPPKEGDAKQVAEAQLGFDIDTIRKELGALIEVYGSSEKILEAQRDASLVDEAAYYQKKREFIQINNALQESVIGREIDRLKAERLTGKDKIENDRKIADAEAKLVKVRGDAATSIQVLGIVETASLKKTENAFIEARAAAQQYLETIQRAQQQELGGIGKGSERRNFDAAKRQIEDRYEAARQTLEGERRRKEISPERYAQELALIDEFQGRAVASYEDYYAELTKQQGDFTNGANEAIANYLSSAANLAKQTEDITSRALGGIEDAFVSLAMTGKADFKSLANSIIADIIRIQARAQAAGLANSLAQLFGSTSQGFSTNQTGTSLPTRGGAAGGTNFVERDMLTIIHKGEAVVPKAYNPAANLKAAAGVAPQFNVSVEGAPARVTRRSNASGGIDARVIVDAVKDELNSDVNNGGPFVRNLGAQTGLTRTPGLIR